MNGIELGIVLATALLGAVAGAAHARLRSESRQANSPSLADRIDALLPQTQCRQCGYAGCRPYANAIADGMTGINRCPPGGVRTIALLAELLGTAPRSLDPALTSVTAPLLAEIDEAICIGCLKCVKACPVDAILGAAGLLHTVIPQLCTGCELCVAPCPVDCIRMLAAPARGRTWPKPEPEYGRAA